MDVGLKGASAEQVSCNSTFASLNYQYVASHSQDPRFSDKELKLLRSTKFSPVFDKKVRAYALM